MTEIAIRHGDVVLFGWNGPEPRADAVFAALGANGDASKLDIFPLARIEPVGLEGLLIDGHGAAPDEVEDARGALAALQGVVVIAPASAFEAGTVLKPVPPATHVATFREMRADRGPALPLESEAAKGTLSGGPAKAPKSDARMSGMVAAVVLVFLAIFVVAFVLMAG